MTARLILNSIEQFNLYLTHVHISKIETYILFELIGGIFPNITLLELILTKIIKTIKLFESKKTNFYIVIKKSDITILRKIEYIYIVCALIKKYMHSLFLWNFVVSSFKCIRPFSVWRQNSRIKCQILPSLINQNKRNVRT